MTSLLLAAALSLTPAHAAGPTLTPAVVVAAPAKAQVYQWPADAAPVQLTVTADMITSLITAIEATGMPGATPEVSRASLEVLRRPYVVTWDLARGVASAPVVDASAIADAVRAAGVVKMYGGVLEMVQGTAQSLSGLRSMAAAVAAGSVRPRKEGGRSSYTFPDGTLMVDRATGLPSSVEVRAGELQVDVRYEGWQALGGGDHAPSLMTLWAPGAAAPMGVYELTWARSGEVWLPRTVAVTFNGSRVVLELAPVL
jgi:hypothetical protein